MNPDKSPRVPRQKRSKELKNRIMAAAQYLFAEKGFYNTSSNEIAAKADVSIGSFYAYFKDKKQLFLEVLQDYHAQVTANIRFSVQDNADEEKAVMDFLKGVVAAHRLSPGFHREIAIMQLSDPDVNKIVQAQNRIELAFTAQCLQAVKKPIAIGDIEAVAFILHSVVEKVVHAIVFSETTLDEERLLKELVKLISQYP